MKTNKSCSLITAVLAAVLSIYACNTVWADDTDIYVNPNNPNSAQPMIMFALDLRANLSSTVCNKFTATDTDATIAANCGWDPIFVSYLTAADKSDGVVTLFEYFRASLAWAMDGLSSVKIGLMVPHNDNCSPSSAGPSTTGCSNGAYIMQGLYSINDTDLNDTQIPQRTYKQEFFDHLANIPPIQGTVAHPFQGVEMYYELFRYLTGEGVWNGHAGYKDYGNTDPVKNLDTDFPLISWDTSIEAKSTAGNYKYISPLASVAACAKIYVVNVVFGVTNSDADSNTAIAQATNSGGLNLNLTGTGKNDTFQAMIQYMGMPTGGFAGGTFSSSSNSTAITIGTKQTVSSFIVTDNVNTTTNAWAQAGYTNNAIALGTDPTALRDKLRNIFSQILSVSTTFVSASVPVNVFNRADYLDDVYMALFEAQKDGLPRWIGNLKKLKLTPDSTGAWYIGDVYKNPAFGADGRINYNALTFWTDPNGWDVQSTYLKTDIAGYDGRSINRGGAGQKIPGFLSGSPGLSNTDSGARQIFTEPNTYNNGTPTALMALDATTTNAQNLWKDLNADGTYASGTTLNNTAWATDATGAPLSYSTATTAQQTEALNILEWARGIDVMDENNNGIYTDTRPWLMADPIHSRPLAINYGIDPNNPDVRIVITGNDGFVHMVQNTDRTSGAESGKENWAFIPRYAMRILDRLKNDGIGGILHPYGVDGAPVLYTYDANHDGNIVAADGDKAYLYFGMRRGGHYYYALDVSNPDKPQMLWSISNNSPDFAELGLTFSTPTLAYLSYKDNSTGTTHTQVPVLVFGGGYDTNKDTRSLLVGTDDKMGNAIYIVNALDGSLIWKAVQGTGLPTEQKFQFSALTDSIPSDVTVLDSDGDGSIDRLYVGDTGGQIFRADLAGLDRTKWTLRVFASVGRHDPYFAATSTVPTKLDDRRFFHAADVVQTRYNSVNYDAVIIGSGDRANPMDLSVGTPVPQNWFYLFKDMDTTSGTTGNNADLLKNSPNYEISQYATYYTTADLTDDCMQAGAYNNPCSTTTLTQLNDYGWKIKLTQAVGEKVLSRPITVDGVIYWTTYLPPVISSTSCEPVEGTGSIYAVNLQDATPAYNWDLTNTYTNSVGTVIEYGATDRYMQSGDGIPADVIVVRKGGVLQAILPGQNYTKAINSNSGYKTFWYTEGE